MEIKKNHLRTKNLFNGREIIINMDAVEQYDFVWNPIEPDESYTQIWVGSGWIKIPFCYKLLMAHFDFYGDELKGDNDEKKSDGNEV